MEQNALFMFAFLFVLPTPVLSGSGYEGIISALPIPAKHPWCKLFFKQ